MEPSSEQQRMWRLAGRYSAVGIEMAVALALGTLGGLWLEKRYDFAPFGLIGGLVVGVGAAVQTIVRVIKTTKLSTL